MLIDFKDADIESQRPLLAMNAALFHEIDLSKAAITEFDGYGMLEPKYRV